ncbi:MAG: patatin-like phospholipase family protein [Clostridiaceae bacterium]|jgi:NTE family protein|nr:patatin-like phospholipase family protein [Clostridiaceae bacterium]
MEGFGLVLAGGGTRGAYQLGVWKALLERQVPISAVVGVSIGAINGAFFCQGDWDLANRAWHEVSVKDLVALPEPLPEPNNIFDHRNLTTLTRLVIQERGLDTSPLRRQMDRYLDEERLRRSSIDLGVLTYSLSEFHPVSVFRGDVPPGQLFDYILASASLPLFRAVKIDGKRFVDGGVYNNRPTEMLLSRGFTRIIEVEVGGIGLVRAYNPEGAQVISIKPDKPIGGILDIRHEMIDANIRQGYRDASQVLLAHHFAG